jgi:hypothetical protein
MSQLFDHCATCGQRFILHYGENRTKLVGFKEQEKYVAFLEPANLA